MAEINAPAASDDPTSSASSSSSNSPKVGGAAAKSKQRQSGVVTRVLRGIFGRRCDDYEKTLNRLYKKEALVKARMKRRAQSSRRMARNLVLLALFLEFIAVTYAAVTKSSRDQNWKMRAARVLPAFVPPIISVLIYSAMANLSGMLELKDRKTLEKLVAERRAKMDELKEKTNYYSTQRLIQRYDLDPTAKAAAATVLASKLGADSGLEEANFLGDDDPAFAGAEEEDVAESKGLGRRAEENDDKKFDDRYAIPNADDEAGLLARIAGWLVGEDPSQCYALICRHCHMHNGLVRKEDFTYMTYYCPHCHELSRPMEECGSESSSNPKQATAAKR